MLTLYVQCGIHVVEMPVTWWSVKKEIYQVSCDERLQLNHMKTYGKSVFIGRS